VLNIMEQFDKQGGFSHAFLTTYEFSPGFFEDRVLKTKAFKSCPYIVILIDEGKYQEICHDPKGGRLINRRYMLIPVKMPSMRAGVFHPKLWFLSGKDHAELFVGSSNLTRSGVTSNFEMVSFIAYDKGSENKSPVGLFRSAYEFIHMVATRHCSYSETLKQTIKQLQVFSSVLSEDAEKEAEIEIIHNLDSSIFEAFLDIQGVNSSKLTVLSPFFDSNIGKILSAIVERVPLGSVDIVVQQNTNTLDVESLRRWHSSVSIDLTVRLLSVPGRKLHAKALLLESQDGETVSALIGSANFTRAALLQTADSGGNIELCLSLRGDMAHSVRKAMQSEAFTTKAVSLADVKSTPQDSEWVVKDVKVKLYHAELDSQNSLIKTVCQLDEDLRDTSLNHLLLVRKIGSADPDTVCQMAESDVEKGLLNFSVMAEDSSILNKAATVAIHTGTSQGDLISNYVWLLNVVEIHDSLEKDHKRIARQFRESGKGLIEFINNYIEHGMVDKAIDLLAKLDIRFDNGGRGIVTRAIIRTPSSPITEDDATELIWRLTSDQRAILGKTVSDFISRHYEKVLRKHLRKPNLNGLENFFDVMETCADLGITALKNGIMTASDIYQSLLYGFQLFSGNVLTEGYFRALWCKFYDVKDRLREALIRYKICERVIAYALVLKTIDTQHSTKEVGFVRMDEIYALTSVNYLSHCFGLVGIDEDISNRVDAVLMESYDNSDYCKVGFDPSTKNSYFTK